jgi:hypothetical protein
MMRAIHGLLTAATIALCASMGCTPADNAAAGAKSLMHEIGDKASDASINFAINAAFVDDELVKSKQLSVSTQGGRVTLRGTQPSSEAKARAIQLASQVRGVRAVADQIAIGPPGTALPAAPAKPPQPGQGQPPAGASSGSQPPPVAPPESVWQ